MDASLLLENNKTNKEGHYEDIGQFKEKEADADALKWASLMRLYLRHMSQRCMSLLSVSFYVFILGFSVQSS